MKPKLILIGGPNGAGKTTLAREYVSVTGLYYLGADAIAEQLAPHDVASVQVEAGRRFVETLVAKIEARESMIVESTLSGVSLVGRLQAAKLAGYTIDTAFVFVESPAVSVVRVAERVRRGGHHVPSDDVVRRFDRSLTNFWTKYREVSDVWTMWYNSGKSHVVVAYGNDDASTILRPSEFARFLTIVGNSDGND